MVALKIAASQSDERQTNWAKNALPHSPVRHGGRGHGDILAMHWRKLQKFQIFKTNKSLGFTLILKLSSNICFSPGNPFLVTFPVTDRQTDRVGGRLTRKSFSKRTPLGFQLWCGLSKDFPGYRFPRFEWLLGPVPLFPLLFIFIRHRGSADRGLEPRPLSTLSCPSLLRMYGWKECWDCMGEGPSNRRVCVCVFSLVLCLLFVSLFAFACHSHVHCVCV